MPTLMPTPAVSRVLGLSALVAAALLAACCKNSPPPAQPTAESKQVLSAGEAPARPTTKESCDACKGKWGRHGLAEADSCICRTKDFGKVCRDGGECEGQCLVEEGDGGFEATEPGPPAKGYWKGKCSEYDTTFGCHKTIPHGARAKKPELPEDAADTICID
jgi:hypothetical protein